MCSAVTMTTGGGPISHLDDVVAAEDSARVAAVAVLSNGALQLWRKQPDNETL